MASAAENQNWQKRQYDSYGPHFRIETANPELGMCGNIAYNFTADRPSTVPQLKTNMFFADCFGPPEALSPAAPKFPHRR